MRAVTLTNMLVVVAHVRRPCVQPPIRRLSTSSCSAIKNCIGDCIALPGEPLLMRSGKCGAREGGEITVVFT